MPKERKIRVSLNAILTSQCFSKSVVNKGLLTFLVEESLKGENPTEHRIAYEVFGKKSDPDKPHNVRIYVHNLRKKLSEYYASEGKNAEVRLDIPKGAYKVTFHTDRRLALLSIANLSAPYILIAGLLLAIIGGTLWVTAPTQPSDNLFLWGNLLRSGHPTKIVLGDHYFFRGESPIGGWGAIRHTYVNSDKDLDELVRKQPGLAPKVKKMSQTFLNQQAPFGLYKVMGILGGGRIPVDMMYASNMSWHTLKGQNVVFIGSFKTQGILKSVSEAIGIDFRIQDYRLMYSTADSVSSYQGNSAKSYPNLDYATLSRFVTDDGRQIISVIGNTDMSNIACLEHICQKDNLEGLERLASDFPNKNFKALFAIRGQDRTGFQTELVRIDPITVSVDEIWP
ncbi:hypothetical protein FUAX_12410 [Fulvitalea axinellae]|uniref:Uncharacterized protein n=1 Tax=Fulvitalea axinellae TaxID=1182444 RepID=A0AAU9D354_9BACT|nr:hypothetical protein FUAX_12410 [Fulvitalea axinellae]